MWESPALNVARDAHSKTAPSAARSLFTGTEYSASAQQAFGMSAFKPQTQRNPKHCYEKILQIFGTNFKKCEPSVYKTKTHSGLNRLHND
jgi:hypothetical protein